MNLPNKLTIARMCAIPVVIVVSLLSVLQNVSRVVNVQLLILLVVFALASITDFLDGKIARKYNLVTNFGKFMDPLADKLLVMATMIAMLELGIFKAFGISFGFVITIILAREFAVTGLRTLAADNGVVIAASKLGKSKTVTQMAMIIYVLAINMVDINNNIGIAKDIITLVLVSLATIMTIVSGIDYFVKNVNVLKEKNNKEN
ncbi:MAG: CDP-diacylglycerol--glycerol-3-phosphate 3-phosphatidyltransferase [Coprobacillus sp.]|nr:CDP-diacylglycerol--glycerol-3-phosphate 3-phosphatidyltransferase [Coprobacillus sp.]MDY4145675.1 CDP-diacylglycerol--glycerol-3-phosphate 3-phosphatidyltransferase [Bacilli bacterium]